MGGFSLVNFLVYVVTCFLNSRFNECTNCGKDGIEELPWCSDCFLDVIRVVDLFGVKLRIMLLNGLLDLNGHISSLKFNIIDELGSIRENLIQIMDFWWGCEYWDGTESSLKMGKDIRNSIFIDDLDEIAMLVDAIVKAADIDEICGFWLIALKFGDLACSFMNEEVPEVKRVFYLKRRRCMKTWSISRRMIALTVLSYF